MAEQAKYFLPAFNLKNASTPNTPKARLAGLLYPGAALWLFGQPGISKSLHVVYMIVCLLLGVPFAGLTPKRQYRVLYLDFDKSWNWQAPYFYAAFAGAGLEPDLAKNCTTLHYWDTRTPQCRYDSSNLITLERLGDVIADFVVSHKIDVVVVDSYLNAGLADQNDNTAISLTLRLGLGPTLAVGASIIVIDHATKPSRDGSLTPLGAQAKRAWANVVVGLYKQDDGLVRWQIDKTNAKPFTPFLTSLTIQNNDDIPESLYVKHEGIVEKSLFQSVSELEVEKNGILSKLFQNGTLRRGQLGGNGGSFNRALKELVDSGKVEHLQGGYYRAVA
jgi:hypothetical protein